MSSHYRHRRTSSASTGFPSPVEPGEIVANTANRQLAIGDADPVTLGQPVALLAIRLFDARAQYVAGDFVINAGALYRAKVSVSPAAFNGSQWDVYSSDVTLNAASKSYVDAGDATVTSGYQTADTTLQNNINAKADKSYVDAADANLAASTQAGFDLQTTATAAKVAKAGDTMTGPLVAPNGSVAAVGVAVGAAGTGMYNSSGALGLAAAGALKLTLSATSMTPAVPIKQIDGTVTSPSYNFGLENSGLYRKSAANVSMSVTQQEVMSWNGTTKTTTAFGPVALPADPANPLEAATKQYVDAHGAPAAATAAEYIANSAPTKMLTPGAAWGAAAAIASWTDSATVTFDFSLSIDFVWALGAAGRTLANPAGQKVGQKGLIILQQGVANATISSWGNAWKFPGGVKPTLSTAAGAQDCISYWVVGTNYILCTFNAGFA